MHCEVAHHEVVRKALATVFARPAVTRLARPFWVAATSTIRSSVLVPSACATLATSMPRAGSVRTVSSIEARGGLR
jgi:hypothetical protein